MPAVQETIERVRRIDVDQYKYGFVTDIESDKAPKGLSEDIVRFISAKKGEPEWMLAWRLDAYKRWLTMREPTWARVDYPKINYQDYYYYAAPKKKALASLDEARAYLAQQAYAKALEQFDAVVRLVPNDVEAHAYGGWIVRLAGLPDEGLARIQRAVDLDASYPDAHFFRGIIYLRDKGAPAGAIPEFQLYLAARPDGPQSDAVRQLLAGAVAATSGDVPSSTTTPR